MKKYTSLIITSILLVLNVGLAMFTASRVGWNWSLAIGPTIGILAVISSLLGLYAKRKLTGNRIDG